MREILRTYDGAEERAETALGLVEILLMVCFQVERSLARLLIRRRLELNLVLNGNLLHDLTERRRLAALTSS